MRMRLCPARPSLVMRACARRARAGSSLLALALSGCLPAETVIGEAITPVVSDLDVTLEGTAVTPGDVVPLADGSLLVDGETADGTSVLVLVPADGRSPELIGAGGEIGVVRSVSTTGDLALIVGEEGVLAISSGALFRVPIEPMLDVMDVRSLAAIEREGMPGTLDWLVSTDAGLYVVRDDTARPVLASGAPVVVSHVAPRGTGSAWVADDEGLLRVTISEDDAEPPRLERLARVGDVTALASDAEGRPWWVEDGALHSLTRDQRVIVRTLPVPAGASITGVTSIAREGELWIHVGDESSSAAGLLHYDGHVFRPIDGVLDGLRVRCASGSACVVLDAEAGELRQLRVRHGALLEGLGEGATVLEPVDVQITPESASSVASMRAEVGATVLTPTDGALRLDPAEIGFGPRTLVVTITWSDGTLPLVLRRSFVVEAAATWAGDIEPLYRAHCADCHGAAGPSARRLDSREGWMTEIDHILPAITSGAMPLGRTRLPEETVALVRTWAGAGFPE